jgi:hypothetical protein
MIVRGRLWDQAVFSFRLIARVDAIHRRVAMAAEKVQALLSVN